MKKALTTVLVAFLVSTSAVSSGQKTATKLPIAPVTPTTRAYISDTPKSVKDLEYYREASIIKDVLGKQKLPVNIHVVVRTLKAIDHNLPKYFPNGPYTRNDFIALVWLESAFNDKELGGHGEYGLFQIMPSEFIAWKVKGNFYDVDVNTRMGFRVLKGKYDKWKDYKKGLQAYNGVIRLKNGQWSEKYWKALEKRKAVIDSVLPHK